MKVIARQQAEKRDKIAEQSAHIAELESALRGEAMSAESRYQLYTEMVERNNAQAARIAELEAALEEIVYGQFGKSVAVKNIAREALKGTQP